MREEDVRKIEEGAFSKLTLATLGQIEIECCSTCNTCSIVIRDMFYFFLISLRYFSTSEIFKIRVYPVSRHCRQFVIYS